MKTQTLQRSFRQFASTGPLILLAVALAAYAAPASFAGELRATGEGHG